MNQTCRPPPPAAAAAAPPHRPPQLPPPQPPRERRRRRTCRTWPHTGAARGGGSEAAAALPSRGGDRREAGPGGGGGVGQRDRAGARAAALWSPLLRLAVQPCREDVAESSGSSPAAWNWITACSFWKRDSIHRRRRMGIQRVRLIATQYDLRELESGANGRGNHL